MPARGKKPDKRRRPRKGRGVHGVEGRIAALIADRGPTAASSLSFRIDGFAPVRLTIDLATLTHLFFRYFDTQLQQAGVHDEEQRWGTVQQRADAAIGYFLGSIDWQVSALLDFAFQRTCMQSAQGSRARNQKTWEALLAELEAKLKRTLIPLFGTRGRKSNRALDVAAYEYRNERFEQYRRQRVPDAWREAKRDVITQFPHLTASSYRGAMDRAAKALAAQQTSIN